jgi:hypothetical protein
MNDVCGCDTSGHKVRFVAVEPLRNDPRVQKPVAASALKWGSPWP